MDWCRLSALHASHVWYRRGFVEVIATTAWQFLAHHEAIFAAEPQLQIAVLADATPEHIAALCRCPGYHRLAGAQFPDLGPAHCAELVHGVSHLRALWVRGPEDASWLAGADVGRLEYISVPRITGELLRAMPALTGVDLRRGAASPEVLIGALPAGVRTLYGLNTAELAVLAASPLAPQIERLAWSGVVAPESLVRFPRLHTLIVRFAEERAARQFARFSLPALRRLSVDWTGAKNLARVFGRQLELIVVPAAANPDELRPLVAGDAWTPQRATSVYLDDLLGDPPPVRIA